MNEFATTIYDIVIIGAGPAGAFFAMELAKARPNLKIALIDGQATGLPKPCGGLLSSDAQKFLAQNNLVLPKNILDDPQIFAVKTIDIRQKLVRTYQRHYINMNRLDFDKWLLSLVPSTVEVCQGRCVAISKENELYKLWISFGDNKRKIIAKKLVGADGAGSIVRRTFFTPVKVQYMAIQQWFEIDDENTPPYSCIFDGNISSGCFWTIHKTGQVVLGGAFERNGAREAFEVMKSRLEDFLGCSFGSAVKTEACLVSSPRRPSDLCTGNESIFLIGEAAGLISSSSFEGLSSAMISGKKLAYAFCSAKSDIQIQKCYRRKIRTLRIKLLLKVIKRLLIFTPFTRYLIMKSGIQSIDSTK